MGDGGRAAGRPAEQRGERAYVMRASGLLSVEGRGGRAARQGAGLRDGVLRRHRAAGLLLRVPRRAAPTVDVSAGVLWVALALSGTLGIGRAFEREREGDTLRALLLSPVPRAALYLSKLAAISLLMLLVEAVARAAAARSCSAPRSPGQPTLDRPAGARHPRLRGGGGAVRRVARPRPLARRAAAAAHLSDGGAGADCRHARHRRAAHRRRSLVAVYWLKFLLVFDAIFVSIGVWVFEPLVAR